MLEILSFDPQWRENLLILKSHFVRAPLDNQDHERCQGFLSNLDYSLIVLNSLII